MSIVYRTLRIRVEGANEWYHKTLYLDKKIGKILKTGARTVAERNDFRVIIPGNTLSHKIALYNGNENIWEGEPISLIYAGEDSVNGTTGHHLRELNGAEGILNSYGYLKAGVKLEDKPLLTDMGVFGMKTENYLLFSPWYEVRDPNKPVEPLLNPVIFKYPYEIEFRFECII